MSNDPSKPKVVDMTFKSYRIPCRIKFFDTAVNENIGRGANQSYSRKLVLLVPEECDETYRFYQAWVPYHPTEHHELEGTIHSPVNSPCRFSVHHPHDKKNIGKPYLLVMTKAIEDMIVKNRGEGRRVMLTTNAAGDEGAADDVEAWDGNFKV